MIKKFAGLSLENKIIMGVLNLSEDTFYKGSLAGSAEEAAARAEKMVEKGAQIIDLGGMSTGPSSEPISAEEEKNRLLPAVKSVHEKVDVPISVDTQRAVVAEESLDLGASIINDISGFKADSEMAQVIADHDCFAIIMANRISGRIRTAEKKGKDISNMEKIKKGLKESLQICKKQNVDLKKISIDPGIGFGRGAKDDLKVLANLDELSEFRHPICLGVSRKSFIKKTLGLKGPQECLPGSLGVTALAVIGGTVDIIRTHDPEETSQLVRIVEAVQRAGET